MRVDRKGRGHRSSPCSRRAHIVSFPASGLAPPSAPSDEDRPRSSSSQCPGLRARGDLLPRTLRLPLSFLVRPLVAGSAARRQRWWRSKDRPRSACLFPLPGRKDLGARVGSGLASINRCFHALLVRGPLASMRRRLSTLSGQDRRCSAEGHHDYGSDERNHVRLPRMWGQTRLGLNDAVKCCINRTGTCRSLWPAFHSSVPEPMMC